MCIMNLYDVIYKSICDKMHPIYAVLKPVLVCSEAHPVFLHRGHSQETVYRIASLDLRPWEWAWELMPTKCLARHSP